MTFPTSHSLDGVYPCNHFMAFVYAPWFDSRYVLNDGIITSHVRGNNLFDDNPLLALDYDDFFPHMCEVDKDLKIPNFWSQIGPRKAYARVWGSLKYAWRSRFFSSSREFWPFVCSIGWRVRFSSLAGVVVRRKCALLRQWVLSSVESHLQHVIIRYEESVRAAIVAGRFLEYSEGLTTFLATIDSIWVLRSKST